jgi:hypothetical protein
MKDKSTTHKAEGLGNSQKLKAEMLKAENRSQPVPPFTNEQQFLAGLRSFMQAGRESRAPGVAHVARFWERKICFSILVTQQRLERSKAAKAKRAALKLQISVGSSTPHPAQQVSESAAPHPACGHLLPRAEKGISPVEAERVAKASPSSSRSQAGVSPRPD